MKLSRDQRRVVRAIMRHKSEDFAELARLTGLNPASDFVDADLRGVNFGCSDIGDFDLSRADLDNADLSRARGLDRARLPVHLLDLAKPDPSSLDARNTFWATGRPPSWAEDWGHDDHGPWVSFRIPGTEVTQRMRWIPPGQFNMGSPENEHGRFEDESPLHPVTIAQGFWMFETACTEALWEAVCRPLLNARGLEFPATEVSWEDAQDFARRLNDLLPGLAIGLPSEAKWEYACRAGTQTPYNFGSRIRKKFVRYNTDRPVPVGSLPANSWGLRETLGNVWEWCEDNWHPDYDGAPSDGSAWLGGSGAAGRVVRGEAWNLDARGVRAAYRFQYDPAFRVVNLGFRCARGQVLSGAEVAAPAALARGRKRGAPPTARAAGAAPPRSGGTENFVPGTNRRAKPVLEKPFWASDTGRDTFGPWADLTIPVRGGHPVTQRLRLIPPGRYMMGSPRTEPGHREIERPRHKVTIERAFWLFDTPCTEALWQAVMRDRLVVAQAPECPVVNVSFADVQRFLSRAQFRPSGLNLILPSEAQWEYACRAGTKTATYAGPLVIRSDNDAPVLDPIAWYGDKSVPVELAGFFGEATFGTRPFAQLPSLDPITGPHPVKQKAPNAWGLYDMLGNVFEWCEDQMLGGYQGAPTDGSARLKQGATERVARGGAWNHPARFIRAAYRTGYLPHVPLPYLGFRCALAAD